ncbi:MAG: hypothetical protein PHV12_03820 [Bacteroidales bacterium]|jgi:hypothetical protein|nr:hypothetical protein [Bacteroidales bacterium]MDD3272675.1 hypothetical protein [Bacteroidales bacterium]
MNLLNPYNVNLRSGFAILNFAISKLKTMKKVVIAALSIIISLNLPAQGKFQDNAEFSGYVRGSFQGFSKNYDLTNVFAQFALKGKYSGRHTIFNAEVWFLGGHHFGEFYNKLEIMEAYAGYVSDKFDFIAGNQIVKWGRTDGFSPTDNISPRDYFFLTSDVDDQLRANLMARIKYRFNPSIDLDIIAIPFYKQSNYRFDLFDMGGMAKFGEETNPEFSFTNATLAGRLNFELPGAGFSLSYFRGYDPYHGFNLKGIELDINAPNPMPSINYSSTPYRKQTIGGDFAIPAGSWIFRGEAAWNITKGGADSLYIPLPSLAYVAAIERDMWGVMGIFQYIGRYTPSYEPIYEPQPTGTDPDQMLYYMSQMVDYQTRMFNRKIFGQQKKSNHAFAFTARKSFAYDTFTAELTAYYNITSREFLLRPKISWTIADNLSMAAGGHIMTGEKESLYDYSAPVMNGLFLELKASF